MVFRAHDVGLLTPLVLLVYTVCKTFGLIRGISLKPHGSGACSIRSSPGILPWSVLQSCSFTACNRHRADGAQVNATVSDVGQMFCALLQRSWLLPHFPL